MEGDFDGCYEFLFAMVESILVDEQLVGAGFNEILNNSLTKSSYYDETQS